MKKSLFTIFLVLVLALPAWAYLDELGVRPLLNESGARPFGMGRAFTGIADDLNTAFYNPGGLVDAKGISLSFKDLENISAVQAYPTGYGSTVGLAVLTEKISDIPLAPPAAGLAGGGQADHSANMVVLSYGTRLTFIPAFEKNKFFRRLGTGINIKGLMGETLRQTGQKDLSGKGWDLDIGALYEYSPWMKIGLNARNILPSGTFGGGKLEWDDGTQSGFPLSLTAGIGAMVAGDIRSPIYLEGRKVLLGFDIEYTRSKKAPLLFKFGGEFTYEGMLFSRAGISQGVGPDGAVTGFNFGFGYRQNSWGIDLAYSNEPVKNENNLYLSVIYFPEEWVFERPPDLPKPKIEEALIKDPIPRLLFVDSKGATRAAQNFETYDDRIQLAGLAKQQVKVFVNQKPVSLNDENGFEVVIPLQSGKNVVLLEAKFDDRTVLFDQYNVLRKARVVVKEEKLLEEKIKEAKTEEEKTFLEKEQVNIGKRKERVEALATLGVVDVSSQKDFSIEEKISRGELAAWLVKASGVGLPKVTENVFTDVPKDHPLAPYIKMVTEIALMQPYPDGTFRPDEYVSQEEGERIFRRFGAIR